MKRYSKSHHGTMHELNITPLLDLAFVLLVIFIITTTPLVEDKNLALPTSSPKPKDPPRKPNYVSLDEAGAKHDHHNQQVGSCRRDKTFFLQPGHLGVGSVRNE